MTDQKAPEQDNQPKVNREEQNRVIIPMMHRLLPPIVQAAALYHQLYPLDKTAPEVVDAVTVAVPLRHFMLMTSLVTNLCVMEQERRQAANDAKVSGEFPQDHIPEGAA
jgi:hypothetical protein